MKLYADEEGSEIVRALPIPTVSAVARVEVPAALWRKFRMGDLGRRHTAFLVEVFEADFEGTRREPPRFSIVSLHDRLLREAAGLVGSQGLRAYDAVQLATALAVRRSDSEARSFACFDRTLRTAAAAHGFALVPA